jgi:hypothetical protein
VDNEKLLAKLIEREDIITGLDGFKIFWPKGTGGGFTAPFLRQIADILDEQNQEMQKALDDYMDGQIE